MGHFPIITWVYQMVKEKSLLRRTLERVFRTPIVVLMVGDWKEGKTDTSLLIAYLLKKWGIITRGEPREKFCELVEQTVGALIQDYVIEEYKAKNDRLRLLAPALIDNAALLKANKSKTDRIIIHT